ncbi:hypothetical protein BCR35DRAFT_350518 [Leucosporidium creatinivorum]|uniref:SET domain-containing protein n=1 Tax=Leucosporidium creatinivorum TaxID=106004 RepID=A0A1Y2FZN4_9BASI|nr:hypothetical protein BCR35DRAFT_350518 [Leucosporidium creatinivorum]
MPEETASNPSATPHPAAPLSPSPPPPVDYQQLGDSFIEKDFYQLAEEAYSRGLATSPPPSIDRRLSLLLRRATARLELGAFKPAHRDAAGVLTILVSRDSLALENVSLSPTWKKEALLPRAQAEEGLRLLPVALASYEEVLSLESTDKEAQDGRSRVLRRLKEAEQADYDSAELFRLGLDVHSHPRQEAADFLGSWKVDKIPGRGGGRGAVATRDIKPGELLLVEKAFETVYPWEVEDGDIDGEIVRSIMRRLEEDGSLARGLMSLYAGPGYPSPMSPPAGLSFATKLESNVSASLDPGRIRGICEYNCFGASPVLPASTSIAPSSSSPTALYPRAAFFNHSCAPNAVWRTYSDILVLRARTVINEGEEIFHSYSAAIPGTQTHRKALEKHFEEGRCLCDLCEAEREDGSEERRTLLEGGRYEELQALVREEQAGGGGTAKEEVKAYVEALEATYKLRQEGEGRLGKLKPALHAAYHLFAEASWSSSIEEGLKWELAAIEAQGGVLNPAAAISFSPSSPPAPSPSPTADDPLLLASSIYNSTLSTMQLLLCAMRSQQAGHRPQAIRRWVQLAVENECILGGGGEAGRRLWEAQYGDMLERMGLEELLRDVCWR